MSVPVTRVLLPAEELEARGSFAVVDEVPERIYTLVGIVGSFKLQKGIPYQSKRFAYFRLVPYPPYIHAQSTFTYSV